MTYDVAPGGAGALRATGVAPWLPDWSPDAPSRHRPIRSRERDEWSAMRTRAPLEPRPPEAKS